MKPRRTIANHYFNSREMAEARYIASVFILILLILVVVMATSGCIKALGSDRLAKYKIWDAGNTSKNQSRFQPTVSITTPFDSDVRRLEERFSISGEVYPCPGRSIKMVYYRLDNEKWTEALVSGHEWAGEPRRFPEGRHQIEAVAYDDLGHESERARSNFTVMHSNFLDSRYLEDNIPESMVAGDRYRCIITYQNIGTIQWSERERYRVVFGDGTPGWDAVETMERDQDTADMVWFGIGFCAPEVPGTYNVSFRMKAGDEWFGERVNKTIRVYPVVRDAMVVNARIPSEIPEYCWEGAEITVRNTGNGTWYMDGNHPVFLKVAEGSSGETRRFTDWDSLAMTDLDTGIGPGCEYTFEFDLYAPPPGEYVVKFRMAAGDTEWFGETLEYKVRVVEF